jgi:4'-phosphopantetheinyl transferase
MLALLLASVSEVRRQLDIFDIEKRLMGGFAEQTTQLNETNRFASSLGKVMVQQLLIDSGVAGKDLSFLSTGEFGKPELPIPNIDFNISHSKDMVVSVVSTSKSVGVDIEAIRDIDVIEYKTVFSEKEWKLLAVSNQPRELFFKLWVKKESLLKAHGSGLQIELSDVEVSDKIGLIRQSDKKGYFTQIDIPSYACFVCTTFEIEKIDMAWFKP